MKSDRGLIISGVVLSGTGLLARSGGLPRNPLIGIRTLATLRSKEAWSAGHLAGGSAMVVGGAGALLGGLGAKTQNDNDERAKKIRRLSGIWMMSWIVVATLLANRAAKAATEQ